VPATALGFVGGAAGTECVDWLRGQGLDFQAFPAERPTRQGLVVRGGGRGETTFLGPDAPPGPVGIRACADYLTRIPDGRLLAVCGSLPGWESAGFDPLRTALEAWARRGSLVVDTYGAPLAWFARLPVELIKVNRSEFGGLRSDLGSIRTAFPVRSWVVTDGARPVEILDGDGAAHRLTPPPVVEVSPTGSGDVLLACLLAARWRRGRSLRDAVAFALPYAAANAADPGVAEFPLPLDGDPAKAQF
jgi:fructose-1-phosphate kinase PfkB-like protein